MDDERISAVEAWAKARGFAFSVDDPDDWIDSLPLPILRDMAIDTVWNVVRDARPGEVPLTIFDLGQGPFDQGGYLTCGLLRYDSDYPPLRIAREYLLDRVENAALSPEPESELERFNAAFDVDCRDRRFASWLVDQRLIDWLMQDLGTNSERPITLETGGPAVLAYVGQVPALLLDGWLTTMDDLAALIPRPESRP